MLCAAERDGARDVLLAAGDAAVLCAFAAIGRSSHSADDGSVLMTAAPFLGAWVLLAPALGAYRERTSLVQALLLPLPAIAIAVPCGCAARGLLQDHWPALPFWIVSVASITLLLEVWRFVHFGLIEATVNALDEFAAAIVDDDD